MIDSHCHLNAGVFAADLEDVVRRAQDAGVTGILVPGIGLEESARAIEIAERFEIVRAAVGIHPHESLQWNEAAEGRIRAWAEHPKVAAIGEIGLDFYRDWSPFDAQRTAFAGQLRLAKELDLPIVVHDREAHEEILRALEAPEHRGLRGVLHCFSGGKDEARRAMDLGFHISFTGSLTYDRGRSDPILESVPLARLLLETDAPWMAPVPHRGKRNEPAFVTHVADALARKVNRTREEVLQVTSAAAEQLFRFP
ncbi:MAG TPA: TatD family hydrolase [bacterium]|nr:TatD family hydrolase [bacterium]